MKIVHMSDLHVGKSKNAGRCQQLFDGVVSKYQKGTKPVIVVTGDIVDDGNRRWQHKKAGELFEMLREEGFKVLTVPGNHDYGSNGIIASAKNMGHYERHVKGNLDFPTIDKIEDCYFIGLDSMEDEHNLGDFFGAEGEIGKSQLLELEVELCRLNTIRREKPKTKIIVYLHHHPFYYNWLLRLKDADDLKEVVRGRVDALLFGHEHLPQRFFEKEEKYEIPLILSASKTTDIEVGIRGNAVYMFDEIELAGDAVFVNPMNVNA